MEVAQEKKLFDPPLWLQRYTKKGLFNRRAKIGDILREHKPRSILEVGCGEGKILAYCVDFDFVETLVGIDLQRGQLDKAYESLQPLSRDYENRRNTPLQISLWEGSLFDMTRMWAGFDALISTEVFEHVYKEQLDDYRKSLFSLDIPLIILTTPNIEFNQLFEEMPFKYRDLDHKFEMNRQEFSEWCHQSAKLYHYDVTMTGVGVLSGQNYQKKYGHATQFAIFRKELKPLKIESFEQFPFQCRGFITYPYATTDYLHEKGLPELEYIIQSRIEESLKNNEEKQLFTFSLKAIFEKNMKLVKYYKNETLLQEYLITNYGSLVTKGNDWKFVTDDETNDFLIEIETNSQYYQKIKNDYDKIRNAMEVDDENSDYKKEDEDWQMGDDQQESKGWNDWKNEKEEEEQCQWIDSTSLNVSPVDSSGWNDLQQPYKNGWD